MIVFNVRHMTAPDNEDDFEPFGRQGTKGWREAVPVTLLPIIVRRPFAPLQTYKRKKVHSIRKRLLQAKRNCTNWICRSASVTGTYPPVPEVPEGFPPTLDITYLRPYCRDGHSGLSSRQAPGYLSCWHRGKKTFDLVTVFCHRLSDYPEFRRSEPAPGALWRALHARGRPRCGRFRPAPKARLPVHYAAGVL